MGLVSINDGLMDRQQLHPLLMELVSINVLMALWTDVSCVPFLMGLVSINVLMV